MTGFNFRGVLTIYRFELARFRRTLWTSLATPVITTALYFVVFGSAIGSRLEAMGGIDYGSFIVPGLTMLSRFKESIFNTSLGIFMPKCSHTITDPLSAPLSHLELVFSYVGGSEA